MRFTIVVSGLFAALAAAQSSSPATTAASPTSASVSPAQASQIACLDKCAPGDVNCQAHCITVPSPNGSQVNATTECVAKCPQGNGSPAETQNYASCINKCISDNYYVTSAGTPEPTGSSGGSGSNGGSGSGSGSGSNGGSGSGSGTQTGGSGTSTATGAAATHSNAAPAIIGSGATLLGVFAALLAL